MGDVNEGNARAAVRRRAIVTEAVVAAAIVATVALILSPSDPGLRDVRPHPMWIAVLVLAARYGQAGFFACSAASLVALATASLLVGDGLGWLSARAQSGAELVAFAGAAVVAWVAGGHERRKLALAEEVARQASLAAAASDSAAELEHVVAALDRRADRAEASVSFLRSIAERLEGGDPVAGAAAALELALRRLGGRAGVVLLHDGQRLRPLVHHGAWSADAVAPPDILEDRTAQRAFDQVRPVSGWDLGARELDSDLAAPIVRADGTPIGVLALRGVGFDALVPRALRELLAIARWSARALGRTPAVVDDGGATTYSVRFRAGRHSDGVRAKARP